MRLVQTYGPLLEMRIFTRRILVVADPALVRECLLKRPKTFRRANSMTDQFHVFVHSTRSLFFAEGEMWARHRRLTAPSFSGKNVALMGTAIGEQIDQFLARLKPSAKEGLTVEMDQEAFYFTIRVISAVAFGGLTGEDKEYFFDRQVSLSRPLFKPLSKPLSRRRRVLLRPPGPPPPDATMW
jgi:cytochrome P450